LGIKKPPLWGGGAHVYVDVRLDKYYEGDGNVASSGHSGLKSASGFLGFATCPRGRPLSARPTQRRVLNAQPPGRATTNTRRDRSRAAMRNGVAVWDDVVSATWISPVIATFTAMRTPGTRLASSWHTAVARTRARSRRSLTGPSPAPPTHVTSSPVLSACANACT
jgi:hypothetical protein